MILGAVMILMDPLIVNMMCITADTRCTKVEASYQRSVYRS